MKKSMSYSHTMIAGCGAYLAQAIVNNFAPLLFVWFGAHYHLSLDRIAWLITFNFAVQIGADLLSAWVVDRVGFRRGTVISHALAAAGTISLGILPGLFPDPYYGLLLAVFLSALGSGGIEVIVSPMIDACPGDRKAASMALLHSFYAWGFLCVTLLSTLFFATVGIDRWPLLATLWGILIICNGILFFFVPIVERPIRAGGSTAASIGRLLKTPLFYILFFLMIAAGASEMAVSQWASAFLEMTVGFEKAVGDLVGPCLFALFMGISRVSYAAGRGRLSLSRLMLISSILAFLAYLIIGISALPVLLLCGFALAGFSVGMLWPGTYSLAGEHIPEGGTPMFSLLALAGDLGCTTGPALAGMVAGASGGDLRIGTLSALVFPAMLIVGNLLLMGYRRKQKKGELS